MALADILKWVDIAKIILPFVFQAKGLDPALAAHVTSLVTDAETAITTTKAGAERRAAVLDGVDQALALKNAAPATAAAVKDLVTIGLDDGIRAVNDIHTLKATPPPTVQ